MPSYLSQHRICLEGQLLAEVSHHGQVQFLAARDHLLETGVT